MGTRKVKRRLNEFDRRLIARRIAMDLPAFPQYGGGIKKQGVISANGFDYNYDEDYTAGAYTIHGGRPRRKFECFLLFVNKDKTAELHSMRQSNDCALQDNASSHNMLHAVLALAKEKGATRIELTDIANKRLPNGKHFRLSDMYILATGSTWYETVISVRPIPDDEATIQRWRQKALTNRWNDVAACLLSVFPTMAVPVDTTDIDGAAAGSAMEVFRRIKEARTDFFADYRDDLLICSGVGPIERITWVADL